MSIDKIYDKAKEKGYSGNKSLTEIQDWLRIDKNIYCEIFFSMYHKKWSINNYFIDLKKLKKINWDYTSQKFDDFDEALILAIDEMLKKI
jgi:hypothetical protein